MIIIAEKINGTLEKVAQAIKKRDTEYIASLAIKQEEAGASYIDVNAGTYPNREAEDLAWLVKVVQDAVKIPVCIDSTNSEALEKVLPLFKQPGMINSVNGDPKQLDVILKLALKYDAKVIALLMDEKGIPATTEERMKIARIIMEEARKIGLHECQIYFDPLVMAITTKQDAGRVFLDTLTAIKREYPEAHIVSGLSNISFGLPERKVANRAFMAVAVGAGMDAAIMNPFDFELAATACAVSTVMGRDPHCRDYLKAYRQGRIY